MNSDPLISILMPVRNSSQYLEDCLQSILNQTEGHWELLAVDDGSSDDCLEILKGHAFTDKRIKVFQNNGRGIVSALRLAYENSTGKLITRMDSDDLMKPGKIEFLKKHLYQRGRGHVCTGYVEYFSENTLGNGYRKYQNWLNSLTETQSNFSEIYKECVIPSPSWMVFREDLESCGAFHPDDYPEDYDLCFRFYQAGLKVIGIQEVLHLWRDYETRTSRVDPNYADQGYFDLKSAYFLKLDHDPKRPLFLWGAGKKGKYLARQLQSESIPFQWVSNNPKKSGKAISGIVLQDFNILKTAPNAQILITVAAPQGRLEIIDFLKANHFQKSLHYYFFC